MADNGLGTIKANMDKFSGKIEDKMEAAATAAVLVGIRYTKENCPRDTGKLSRSYGEETREKSKEKVVKRAGTDVDYAPHQEFGTVKMSGKPHMRPGFFNHGNEMLEAAAKELKKVV